MRLRIPTFMVVLAIACTGSMASAADIYVLENNLAGLNGSNTRFGRIDTTTGVYTQIASLNFTLGNLAWNQAAGNFYVTEGAGASTTLRTIETDGTLSSSLGTIGKTIYGMAYRHSDNTIYGIAYIASMESGAINPANGSWTTLNFSSGIGNPSPPVGGRSTIMNDVWYVGGNYSPEIGIGTFAYTAGASYQQIGSNPFFSMMSITNDGTTMYGLWGNGTTNTKLYTINTATGASTQIATITGTTGGNFHGAAMIPVPEPSTYALGVIATAVIGLLARRRKAGTII